MRKKKCEEQWKSELVRFRLVAYRDSKNATLQRRAALAEEFASLTNEVTPLLQRRAEVEVELQEIDEQQAASRKKRVPLLFRVKVSSPCKARWENMVGDQQVRFCTDCGENVYNLSELSDDQAEALLREKQEKLCAFFYRRSDGTILTKDCPSRARDAVHRRRSAIAVGVVAAGAAYLGAEILYQPTLGGIDSRPPRMVEDMDFEPVPVEEWVSTSSNTFSLGSVPEAAMRPELILGDVEFDEP